jgi:hypothetical protein
MPADSPLLVISLNGCGVGAVALAVKVAINCYKASLPSAASSVTA